MYQDDLTAVWKALSEPARRGILDLLRQKPRTTGELCREFAVSRYAVMKHLNVLERAGLVLVRRQGRLRWNRLNPVPIEQIYARWIKPYEGLWAKRLLELKSYAEFHSAEEGYMAGPQDLAKTGILQIEQEVTIKAAPARVFKALTAEIGEWWPFRTKQEKKGKIILEPEVGGKFYETWGKGEGLLWGTVVQFIAGQRLDIVGMIGMSRLVHTFVSFSLEEKKGGTLVKLSHRGLGEISDKEQGEFGEGWKEIMQNYLKNYVEKGIKPEI